MLERTCFHIDKEAPAKRKSGWSFSSFHAETTVPGYEKMEFRACDLEHAKKQAKSFVKKHGGQLVSIRSLYGDYEKEEIQ